MSWRKSKVTITRNRNTVQQTNKQTIYEMMQEETALERKIAT